MAYFNILSNLAAYKNQDKIHFSVNLLRCILKVEYSILYIVSN